MSSKPHLKLKKVHTCDIPFAVVKRVLSGQPFCPLHFSVSLRKCEQTTLLRSSVTLAKKPPADPDQSQSGVGPFIKHNAQLRRALVQDDPPNDAPGLGSRTALACFTQDCLVCCRPTCSHTPVRRTAFRCLAAVKDVDLFRPPISSHSKEL
ncbi:hypothetical protein WMY93_014689 [Mugilogobius chulae]|uniref:Uncharacterized protein n=1 Tax=Mugilogobius chulae TaxID=88201 RepID=A0AAW0NZI2_9GOBI